MTSNFPRRLVKIDGAKCALATRLRTNATEEVDGTWLCRQETYVVNWAFCRSGSNIARPYTAKKLAFHIPNADLDVAGHVCIVHQI